MDGTKFRKKIISKQVIKLPLMKLLIIACEETSKSHAVLLDSRKYGERIHGIILLAVQHQLLQCQIHLTIWTIYVESFFSNVSFN